MKKQHLRDLFNNAIAFKAAYVGVKLETRGMENRNISSTLMRT